MILFVLFYCTNGVFFTLKNKGETCIGIKVKGREVLWGEYVLSGENEKEVIVTLYDPKNTIEYSNAKNTREGKFHIKNPSNGTHRLCFKLKFNERSVNVSFEMKTEELAELNFINEGQIQPFENKLSGTLRNLKNVMRNIKFYQRRERVYNSLSEKTCERLLWTAGLKVFGLLFIFLLQIFGITKILSSTSIKV